MSSGRRLRAGLFCATYLEPEAQHIHRHVNALTGVQPVLLTQKVKGTWSGVSPVVVRRSRLREVGRVLSRWRGTPWQIGSGEACLLERVLSLSECRLLHVFSGDTAIHLLPLLRRLRIPLLVSFHGADVTGEIAAFPVQRAELFARAARVACRSADLAREVERLGCPRDKLLIMRAVLPEAPDLVAWQVPADGTWRIVQAGRLIPKKGFETALRAFAAFRDAHPQARFVVAGEGPLRPRLEALRDELNLGACVEMPGFLSQEALGGLLRAAHIYIHPSEEADGDREGVPNALLEAMAAGLPCVATRHGGIPEVIADGRDGLLCDEGDPAGLAACMLRLAAEPGLAAELARAGRKRVEEEFSPGQAMRGIEAIYSEVADSACEEPVVAGTMPTS